MHLRSSAVGAVFTVFLALASACAIEPASALPPPVEAPAEAPPPREEISAPPEAVDPPRADPFEPPPPPTPLPEAAIEAMASDIAAILGRAAFTRSVRIENASTGQVIVTATPDRLLKPASNTKLFTTGAALEALGEDHAMTLRAYGSAAIGADGVIPGDLTVLTEHNFTTATSFYDSAREPFDRLAQALRRRGLTRVGGATSLSGEVDYAGSSVGTLDVAAQRTRAAAELGAALTAAGILHGAVSTSASLAEPAGSILLVEYAPMTISVGISPVNVLSHNQFADLLSRHLGHRISGTSSYAAGGNVMIDWAKSLNAPTAGMVFNDGSGLSGQNRVSADAIVHVLEEMTRLPEGPVWKRSMAIGGVRGTLATRLTTADTRGRFFGKTGTLNDTIALSGYLDNRHDGQEYVVSILLNAVTNAATARAMTDDIVRVVARDHRKSAPRPNPPALTRVRGGIAKGLLEISWSAVEGSDGYLVYISKDGRTWPREAARLVRSTRFVAGDLPDAPSIFVRVTARDAAGLESDPSVAMAATALATTPDILFVDANERWLAEPQVENTLEANHDFLVNLARSSLGRRFDSIDHRAVTGIDLSAYRAVVWAAGETGVADGPLDAAEQAALSAYLAKGGAVLFSGSEILFSLVTPDVAADVTFARDVLKASYVADSSETFEFEGMPDTDFAAIPAASFLTPDAMRIGYPDVLGAEGGSVELMRYVGGRGGSAAVGFTGTGRRIVTGFPVESIASGVARRAVLDAAYRFLGVD